MNVFAILSLLLKGKFATSRASKRTYEAKDQTKNFMQDTLLIADNEPQAIRKTRTCMQIFF